MPAIPWDSYSLLLVYSAIAVYALAFVVCAIDVARRQPTEAVAQPVLVGAGAPAEGAPPAPPAPAPRSGRSLALPRIGFALTVLGWLLHVAGAVLRGVAAGRVPWSNLYEFALTSIAIIVAVYIVAQFWQELRYLGVYMTGIATLFLGLATVNFYVAPVPLPPSLQTYWLVIHVFVAALGTGFFGLGSGLSILQLLRTRVQRVPFIRQLPSAATLEDLAYRVGVIGFIFWTFTLIAGSIWAEAAWGRYWGWDVKEVWTFIIWVVYAGYLHARATRGWRGTRSSWLQLIGFSTVIFNFVVVNQFFTGLHAYSGLTPPAP